MELNTVQGKLYVASPDTGLFIRLFDGYALSDAAKPYPEIPCGDISFLDCIRLLASWRQAYHQYKSVWPREWA